MQVLSPLKQSIRCTLILQLLLLAHRASASINVFDDKNSSITTIDDTSANFGPSISDDGFLGYIALAKPISACTPVESPPNVPYVDPKQWIALVLRTPSATGNCSFDLKVYNAQKAGYSAVIVYNSESDNLIKMSSSGLYNIKIPSVFIGHSSGLELARYYTYENRTYVIINNDDNDFNYLMVPFIIVISICFFVAIVLFIVKFIIHCHKMRKNRFPKSALKKIPTKKYQKTDKYDTCPICLNDFEEGVKMRILPCEHAYHVDCIDKWLLRNNRSCPVCKRRVIPGGPDSDSEENSENTNSTPTHSGYAGEPPVDVEANEDEDTNESSRLLVHTARNAQPNDEESLIRNMSNPNMEAAEYQRATGSMNNQMTTSGSNQVTASASAEQLKQSSSRYGSICSVNSLTRTPREEAEGASSAANPTGGGEGDEDEEYEKQLKSHNHVILINEAKRKKEHAPGKETPEYFTPQSATSESSAVISSSSFTPVHTDRDQVKLKTYSNTTKKAKKSKTAKRGDEAAAATTVSETGGARSSGTSKGISKRRAKANKVDVEPPPQDQASGSAETPATSNETTDKCTNINYAYDRLADDEEDSKTAQRDSVDS